MGALTLASFAAPRRGSKASLDAGPAGGLTGTMAT